MVKFQWQEARMTTAEPVLPQTLKAGLDRYLEHGILPGSFLLACLENDMARAVAIADSFNTVKLSNIIAYLIVNLPDEAWGTPEKVEKWHIQKTKLSMQGGRMSGELMLMLGAFVILVISVLIYTQKDNTEHGRLADGVESYSQISERLDKEMISIRANLTAHLAWKEVQVEFNDKIMQRMQYLELRMDANKSVHPVQFPKSMKLEISTPTAVKILHAPATRKAQPPPLPVGKPQQKKAISP